MTIIQRPQSVAFAADLQDYIIDSDASITFDVKKANRLVLSEDYSPDGHFSIRTHKLGKFCAQALWGRWPQGFNTIQENLMSEFSFIVNGALDQTTRVIGSRARVFYTPTDVQALTLAQQTTVNFSAPFYVSMMLAEGEKATAYASDAEGSRHSVVLYSHVGPAAIVTIDASPARIAAAASIENLYRFQIGGLTVIVDQTRYLEVHSFRFMNNFECPEAVAATGSFVTKGAQKSENAFMDGKERKFRVVVRDEYTVNSGVIFSQADYKLWHELISARQVQALLGDQWVDIIITKSKYERSYKKNILKSVEFSFVVADPDEITEL